MELRYAGKVMDCDDEGGKNAVTSDVFADSPISFLSKVWTVGKTTNLIELTYR